MELDRPIGERIAIYRRRRGISQAVLAGLVGRSESWLSQVERGTRSVDRLSVLIDIAKVLKVDVGTLTGQPFSLAPNGGPDFDKVADIRLAMTEYHVFGRTAHDELVADFDALERAVVEMHTLYQATRYSQAGGMAPLLIRHAEQACRVAGPADSAAGGRRVGDRVPRGHGPSRSGGRNGAGMARR